MRAGRLRVLGGAAGAAGAAIGEIEPGEPVGEMAALEGGVHGASVLAARDCELWSLPRSAFLRAAANDAVLMAEIALVVVERVRGAVLARKPGPPPPVSIGFFAVGAGAPVRPLVERTAAAIRALGRAVEVVGGGEADAPAERFSKLAAGDALVLYAIEVDEVAWRRRAGRQADAAFAVVDGGISPPALLPPDL
ncbi:MAG: cyclic nucleotide-binding domain-containing protein, partial [Caulobacteraceae bacterium]